jgi:hypothetical protein
MKVRDILAARPVSPVEMSLSVDSKSSPVQHSRLISVHIVGEAIHRTPEPAPFMTTGERPH